MLGLLAFSQLWAQPPSARGNAEAVGILGKEPLQ